MARAFRQWHQVTVSTRVNVSNNKAMSELKMKLMEVTNKLYEVSRNDNNIAALLAEQSYNRELSLVNIELRNDIAELQTKLVEIIPGSARGNGNPVTNAYRTGIVQDVLVSREDEIVKCRRDNHELQEKLKQYETFYKVDQQALKTSRGKSRSPGRGDNSRSRSPSRGGNYSSRGRSSSPKKRVSSKVSEMALRDINKVCSGMSTKTARQVLLLEMKRLNDTLRKTNEEYEDIKLKVRTI